MFKKFIPAINIQTILNIMLLSITMYNILLIKEPITIKTNKLICSIYLIFLIAKNKLKNKTKHNIDDVIIVIYSMFLWFKFVVKDFMIYYG